MRTWITAVVGMAVCVSSSIALAQTRLQGAGASFPNPLYQRWAEDFHKSHEAIQVDYQSTGSGAGIKAITDKTVDFAGSDAPMSRAERERAPAEVLHLPTVAGAVVPAYNLPDLKEPLNLSGEVLADIYLGTITRWNDPRIGELNEGVTLPDMAISPVYRADSSGTTFVFTNYLSTQSKAFREQVGPGKEVKFPRGQAAPRNDGVTAAIQRTAGSIGYIELNFAIANKIPYAAVKNRAGNFILATPATTSAAGEGAVESMKNNLAVNIWNQPGEQAYPISAFTYVIVYKDLGYLGSREKAEALVTFLRWAATEGQETADDLDYAPLSEGVQTKVLEAIDGLTFEGQPLSNH